VDFLDFIARQILALLGAVISAALSLSWQPLERFLHSTGGGSGGVVLLLLALLAAGSLLLLGGAVIFYLRRRHRQARPEPAVRSK
jgi:hypothetical protein